MIRFTVRRRSKTPAAVSGVTPVPPPTSYYYLRPAAVGSGYYLRPASTYKYIRP